MRAGEPTDIALLREPESEAAQSPSVERIEIAPKASSCCGSARKAASAAGADAPAAAAAIPPAPALAFATGEAGPEPRVGCCGPSGGAASAAIAPSDGGLSATMARAARTAYRTGGAPVIAVSAILAALAVTIPAQAVASLGFALGAFGSILPFFAISIGLAAGAKATGADNIIARAFAGRQGRSIAVAALVGALSPFCSCGVIPVVTGLLIAGVPIAPVMAFWIASPLMDPNMFVLTAATLGLEFAVAKTVLAIGMGLLAGTVAAAVTRTGVLDDALKVAVSKGCGPSSCGPRKPARTEIVWRFWDDPARAQTFLRSAGSNSWLLGRWLFLAFVLESLMVAFIPGDLVAQWLGADGPFAVPLAVALGIPAYLNGYAAIPLVSGLITLGMSPAVGLGFMMSGGVTSIPAAFAVWAVAKPRLFGLYIALATLGAMGAAYAYGLYLALV